MTKGWKLESARHALARKGIETGRKKKIAETMLRRRNKTHMGITDTRIEERLGLDPEHYRILMSNFDREVVEQSLKIRDQFIKDKGREPTEDEAKALAPKAIFEAKKTMGMNTK